MGLGIRRGDNVVVIAGVDRGKRGRVLDIDHGRQRVVVQNVNYIWKHVRRSQKNPQGGRIQKEAPIHVSNVMLADPESGKPTRFANRLRDVGGKVRVSRKSDKPIETPKGA